MKALGITLLSVAAAIAYGIAHDLVTARVCVEYFTIGHPRIFESENPTVLGIGWGIVGTWWLGLLLGVALAAAARFGDPPKVAIPPLLRPIAVLLVVMGTVAAAAGVLGWSLASAGAVFLVGPIVDALPLERHVAVLAVLWAHWASYGIGTIGAVMIMVRVWRARRSAGYDP